MLPDNWSEVALAEIIKTLSAGICVDVEERPALTDEFGLLKTSAVYYGRFRPSENKKIRDGITDRLAVRPKAGDVLISRINTADLVGASCYVDRDVPNLFLPDRLWKVVLENPTRDDSRWLA